MHLRSYEKIIIRPSCLHAIEEARLWSYKTDRLSGDILPVVQDGNDHIFDAARYALEPVMRGAINPKHITTPEDNQVTDW